MKDFKQRFEKLIQLLKTFEPCESNEVINDKINTLTDLINGLTSNKQALQGFYNNNLTDKSLKEIELCINHINKNRAKLAILGIGLEWELDIVNLHIDSKIIFRLVKIYEHSKDDNKLSEIDYDSLQLNCYNPDNDELIDRLIIDLEQYYKVDLVNDSPIKLKSILKMIRFTPETINYRSLHDISLDKKLNESGNGMAGNMISTLINQHDTIDFLGRQIKSIYLTILDNSSKPDIESTLPLSKNTLKKIDELREITQYNLENIINSLIKSTKAYGDSTMKITNSYYIAMMLEKMTDISLVMSIMMNQTAQEQLIKGTYKAFGASNFYIIGNKSTFYKYCNSELSSIHGSLNSDLTKLYDLMSVVTYGEMQAPTELIELLNYLKTNSIIDAIEMSKANKANGNRQSMDSTLGFRLVPVVTPQIKSLIVSLDKIIEEYRAKQHLAWEEDQ